MLKKALGVAILALSSAASAQAADLSYRRQVQPYTVNQPLNGYSWAGPYLGANLGYNFGDVSNSGTSPSGVSAAGS